MRTISLFCLGIVLLYQLTFSTWVKTNWPSDGNISCLIYNGSTLYAGLNRNLFGAFGVYSSTDGLNWTAKNTGLPDSIICIHANGSDLYAGTSRGVYYSGDNGATWSQRNSGLPNDKWLYAFASQGSYVFAGTNAGVYRTSDRGITWTATNSGSMTSNRSVYSLFVLGTTLLAPTDNYVYSTANNGTSWSTFYAVSYIQRFALLGTTIIFGKFSSTGAGVYYSKDGGTTWTASYPYMGSNMGFAIYGGVVFEARLNDVVYPPYSYVYMSRDTAKSWTMVDTTGGFGNRGFVKTCVCTDGTYLYAGTALKGVWRKPLSEIIAVEKSTAVSPSSEIQIFPNPGNPSINIINPSAAPVEISIYSISGKHYDGFILQASSKTTWPNQKDIPSGQYLIKANNASAKVFMLCK